jgi:hypothetical protein
MGIKENFKRRIKMSRYLLDEDLLEDMFEDSLTEAVNYGMVTAEALRYAEDTELDNFLGRD